MGEMSAFKSRLTVRKKGVSDRLTLLRNVSKQDASALAAADSQPEV